MYRVVDMDFLLEVVSGNHGCAPYIAKWRRTPKLLYGNKVVIEQTCFCFKEIGAKSY